MNEQMPCLLWETETIASVPMQFCLSEGSWRSPCLPFVPTKPVVEATFRGATLGVPASSFEVGGAGKGGSFPENHTEWPFPRPQGFSASPVLSAHSSLPHPSLSVILKSIPRETIPMAIRTPLQASLGLNWSDTSLPLRECVSWPRTNSAWGRGTEEQ